MSSPQINLQWPVDTGVQYEEQDMETVRQVWYMRLSDSWDRMDGTTKPMRFGANPAWEISNEQFQINLHQKVSTGSRPQV
jgi:hypothetical protein